VIAAELFQRFDRLPEGDLSRLRANLVRQEALHQVAQGLALGEHLRLGEGELKSGGFARPSILADAFEALVGAIFLDGGFVAAQETIRRLYEPVLAGLDPKTLGKDPKTLLQELLQARKIALPQYSVVATQGAAHDQKFEVECLIPELSVRTLGSGSTRRTAEQDAATRAFEKIR
jgi:ribonuclease-3